MKTARSIALAFVVGLVATLTATGQSPATQPTHLALEVHFYPGEPPGYVPVPPTNSTFVGDWFGRFKRVSGWTPPPGTLQADAVNFRPTLEGDTVRVFVSLLMGTKHEAEKNVGAYVLHEGEKLRLQELAEFGVEPFEIALVRVAPANVDPPQVISKGKSVELVTIHVNLATLTSYRLALRNVSSKNVSALSTRVLVGDRLVMSGLPHDKEGKALIPAGTVSEITLPGPTRALATPGGYEPANPSNQVIEISAVVFDDGSFEGDVEVAATFRSFLKGRKIQLRRVIAAFQDALQNDPADPSSALELLHKRVSALGIEADSEAVHEVASEFSALPQKPKRDLKGAIEVAMSGLRKGVEEDIEQFRLGNPNPNTSIFRFWLVATKQRYEAWLARL